MTLTLDQQIAAIAALAAVAAAFFAWTSWRVSKRSLKLAEQDNQEKHTGIGAYLIDGVRWSKSVDEQQVAFACSISNTANAPLAVVRIDLHLHAFDKTGNLSKAILEPAAGTDLPFPDATILSAPLNLNARSTVSGWIKFRLPTHVCQSLTIDKYELVFDCSTGERTKLEQFLIKNIHDENQKV